MWNTEQASWHLMCIIEPQLERTNVLATFIAAQGNTFDNESFFFLRKLAEHA
jgi:hypothetical protein